MRLSLLFILGGLSGAYALSTDSDVTIKGPRGDSFGKSVAALGTLKAPRLAIGAPEGDTVYIYRDGKFGKMRTRFIGAAGGEAGWSMTARDLVGDRSTDLIIGAPSEAGGKGVVYIVDGDDAVGTTDLDGDDARITITGDKTGDYAGWAVTTGDFDGDGDMDLAIGAPGRSTFEGAVYVAYGPIADGDYSIDDFLRIDGAVTWTDGVVREAEILGMELASGDFNSDGQDDLALGTAWGAATLVPVGTGRAYVIWDLPAGDKNIVDVVDKTTFVGEVGVFTTIGSTLAVGDMNGDGIDDLGLGGASFNCLSVLPAACAVARGEAAVILGKKRAFAAVEQTADAAGLFIKAKTSWRLGESISFGDIDNDGDDDLLVGDPGLDESYLFKGGVGPGVGGDKTNEDADATFTGPAYSGQTVFGGYDDNGDKKKDVVIITSGQQTTYQPAVNDGRAYIVYGD